MFINYWLDIHPKLMTRSRSQNERMLQYIDSIFTLHCIPSNRIIP